MKNLNMIMAVVLKSLGIKAFAKNEAGKLSLSNEQTEQLTGLFGQKFTEAFTEALVDFKEETALEGAVPKAVNGLQSADAGEQTAEVLMNALREHHSNVVATELKTLKDELQQVKAEKKTLQDTVEALSASSEELPAANSPSFKGADGKPVVMKVNANHAHYTGVQEFLKTGNHLNVQAATIEVADLKSEFGTFLSQNQNNLEIIKQLFNGFTSSKYFTTVPAVTEYRAVQAFITSVSQQFSAKWNPSGKAKFTPLTIKNRRHKINYPIIPADVLDSYMFKLYDEGLTPDQMPITKYIWNELLQPALEQDHEFRMVWKGKFVDRQVGNDEGEAGTAPEDSMDGIETILVDAKAAGNTGIHFFNKYPNFNFKTATNEQILDFIEDFVDWLSPFYKSVSMPLFVSAEFKRRYKRAYKKLWGAGAGLDQGDGSDKIDFSNNMLVAPDGMYGSPIVFTTPKQNMIKLRHKNEAPNVIKDVQKHGYEVRLFGEYWMAVGFAIGEAVFAFVPNGYDPKAAITSSLGAFNDYQDFATDDFASDGGGL